jgi:hypothetical protein
MIMKSEIYRWLLVMSVFGMALYGLLGCSDSSSPTSPTTPTTLQQGYQNTQFGNPGNGSGPIPNPGTGIQPATPEVLSAMESAIQDEYHAEATYDRILSDLGNVWPFINIVEAERRHIEAAAGLFANRGIEVPESQWNRNNVARFDSVVEACAAAAQAERDNVSLYDTFLKMELPTDVRNVFTNNRAASLEAHLPAFEACAGR